MSKRDYKNFAIGESYHVFNRGNDKMDIFRDDEDYDVFLSRLEECLYPRSASHGAHVVATSTKGKLYSRKLLPEDAFSLLAYCLMPNHFHFLILQQSELPISALMLKLISGYSKYFNKKYERVGSLFQDQFKATYITDTMHLLHTSAYIHNNPEIDGIAPAEEYPYSSCREYVKSITPAHSIIHRELIGGQFPHPEAYRDFMRESMEITRRAKSTSLL